MLQVRALGRTRSRLGTAPTRGSLRGRLVIEYRLSLDRSNVAAGSGTSAGDEPAGTSRPEVRS